MNKARRKEIARAIELIEEAREILENVRDEEQDAFDNMPESIQSSERGEAMEEYISILDDFIDERLSADELEEIAEG